MTTHVRLPGVSFTGITPPTDDRLVNGALPLVDNTHPLATKTTAAPFAIQEEAP